MSIALTTDAAERVRDQLAKRGHGVGLRLGIKRSGCSGWSYTIDFADEIGDSDLVFDAHGVQVVVDRAHLDYMDGTELDYAREGLNESFRFRNPKAAATCGCGESFTVDRD